MLFSRGLFSTLILIIQTQGQKCSDKADPNNFCKNLFGNSEYAICNENGICGCLDFFGPDISRPPQFKCVKGVPAGKNCTTHLECEIALGQKLGKCSDTKKCECSNDPTGLATKEVEGRCYRIKALEDPCEDNKECILGSNEFARCLNATCQCLDSEIATFLPDEDGKCVAEEKKISINTLAVTLSCSAILFAIIVALYMATRPT